MKIYFVQVFWKEEWSPVFITSNEEKARSEYEMIKGNWEDSTEAVDVRLDEMDIDSDVYYDYDWFAE